MTGMHRVTLASFILLLSYASVGHGDIGQDDYPSCEALCEVAGDQCSLPWIEDKTTCFLSFADTRAQQDSLFNGGDVMARAGYQVDKDVLAELIHRYQKERHINSMIPRRPSTPPHDASYYAFWQKVMLHYSLRFCLPRTMMLLEWFAGRPMLPSLTCCYQQCVWEDMFQACKADDCMPSLESFLRQSTAMQQAKLLAPTLCGSSSHYIQAVVEFSNALEKVVYAQQHGRPTDATIFSLLAALGHKLSPGRPELLLVMWLIPVLVPELTIAHEFVKVIDILALGESSAWLMYSYIIAAYLIIVRSWHMYGIYKMMTKPKGRRVIWLLPAFISSLYVLAGTFVTCVVLNAWSNVDTSSQNVNTIRVVMLSALPVIHSLVSTAMWKRALAGCITTRRVRQQTRGSARAHHVRRANTRQQAEPREVQVDVGAAANVREGSSASRPLVANPVTPAIPLQPSSQPQMPELLGEPETAVGGNIVQLRTAVEGSTHQTQAGGDTVQSRTAVERGTHQTAAGSNTVQSNTTESRSDVDNQIDDMFRAFNELSDFLNTTVGMATLQARTEQNTVDNDTSDEWSTIDELTQQLAAAAADGGSGTGADNDNNSINSNNNHRVPGQQVAALTGTGGPSANTETDSANHDEATSPLRVLGRGTRLLMLNGIHMTNSSSSTATQPPVVASRHRGTMSTDRQSSAQAAMDAVHWPPPLDLPAWVDELPNVPQAFRCPITLELMREPTIANSGVTYERTAIFQWLQDNRGKKVDPITKAPLKRHRLFPNLNLRHMIEEWVGSPEVQSMKPRDA